MTNPAFPEIIDAIERGYNPRVTVSDTAEIVSRWMAKSAAARDENLGFSTRQYGQHPRELYDLFRAKTPKGCLIYIHGGYWRMLSKDEHAFVARTLVPQGYSVITLNYPLCPDVRVADIVISIRKAILAILPELLPQERENLVLSGHSAGGYLTAAMLAQDWAVYGLESQPFHGALAISGVFDLKPLLHTSMNAQIRLDHDQVQDLRLAPPQEVPPFLLAVGAQETPEFHAQSHDLVRAWGLPAEAVFAVEECNHFTVIEELALAGSPLLNRVLSLLDNSR